MKTKQEKQNILEWVEYKLGDICYIVMGQSPQSKNYNNNRIGLPLIQGNADIANSKTITNIFTSEITREAECDDIILTVRAPVGVIAKVAQERVCIGRGVCAIKRKDVDLQFIFYFLKHCPNIFRRYEQGSTFSSVNTKDIKSIRINVPDTKEQKRIVGVLGVWDRGIEGLKRKIEIKKEIKKGLMQGLLTGERRLPGFKGEWKNYEIGKIVDYEQPTNYLVSDTDYCDTKKTPVLTAGKTFLLGYTDEKDGVYDSGPVIIFDDFTTANKYVDFNFKVKSSAMKMLTARKGFNLRFIYERMQLLTLPQGGHKRRYLSEYQYLACKIPDKSEQDAIVVVVEYIDQEINLLEKKLTLWQEQKKYLLNNLVTGEIRTPEDLIA